MKEMDENIISKEELSNGYDLYYGNHITILELLAEYVFRSRYSDVEKLFGNGDFLIDRALVSNFEQIEVEKIKETGTQFSVIGRLYEQEKKRKNRDDVISDVLRG